MINALIRSPLLLVAAAMASIGIAFFVAGLMRTNEHPLTVDCNEVTAKVVVLMDDLTNIPAATARSNLDRLVLRVSDLSDKAIRCQYEPAANRVKTRRSDNHEMDLIAVQTALVRIKHSLERIASRSSKEEIEALLAHDVDPGIRRVLETLRADGLEQ